ESNPRAALLVRNTEVPVTMFTDPDPFQEFAYPNVLAAKRAIADYLAIPLAKLPPEQSVAPKTKIESVITEGTLFLCSAKGSPRRCSSNTISRAPSRNLTRSGRNRSARI